jgi:hypothetical protein
LQAECFAEPKPGKTGSSDLLLNQSARREKSPNGPSY